MNEQNLEALKKTLLNLGFGEGMNSEMEKRIRSGQEKFNLEFALMYHTKTMIVDLSFKKGDQNEMYFFNKYNAQLGDREMTFYINKGNNFTSKEAFNLLEGRAVNKDLTSKTDQKYNAWTSFDFSKKEEDGSPKRNTYHVNYGYDLNKAMAQYPIKDLADAAAKDNLQRSLLKGNQQSVHMIIDGKEIMHYVQANPQFKDLSVFDKSGKELRREQTDALKQIVAAPSSGTTSQKQPAHQAPKPPQSPGDDVELKKKRTRKTGLKM